MRRTLLFCGFNIECFFYHDNSWRVAAIYKTHEKNSPNIIIPKLLVSELKYKINIAINISIALITSITFEMITLAGNSNIDIPKLAPKNMLQKMVQISSSSLGFCHQKTRILPTTIPRKVNILFLTLLFLLIDKLYFIPVLIMNYVVGLGIKRISFCNKGISVSKSSASNFTALGLMGVGACLDKNKMMFLSSGTSNRAKVSNTG